ncbi:MAG: hypothetical protein HQL50_02110 [Magnetococcales bacterium]|nr:hypothetical protein [Magnetococcales bacterium]
MMKQTLRPIRLLLGVVALLVTPFAVNAETVVVMEAKGVALTPGQILDGAEPLALRPGQSVTLITRAGRIVRRTGPTRTPPAPHIRGGEPGLSEVLGNLMADSKRPITTPHGKRREAEIRFLNESADLSLPDPWLIDASIGGHRCHRRGDPLIFWRADDSQDLPLRVHVGNGLWSGSVVWKTGKSKLMLPSSTPQLNGVAYYFHSPGRDTTVVIHEIPDSVQDGPVAAAWMKEKGCLAQFKTMARTLR